MRLHIKIELQGKTKKEEEEGKAEGEEEEGDGETKEGCFYHTGVITTISWS